MLIAEGNDRKVWTVDAGRLRLDGGAMFGVVPKPLWSRRIPADAHNRIPMAMRCLYIEAAGVRILVDTGLGNKEDRKFLDIHGVDNAGHPTRLEDSLRALGVEPDDVDWVVNTHLHFDHAGGNTARDAGGEVRAAFANARYAIRRGEWQVAHSDNERIRAGYLAHNYELLAAEGRVEWIDADGELLPGVRLLHTPGHTAHHQCVVVEAGGETVCFLADLVPTAAHVRLPWIMAYDVEPLVTLETKRRVLTRAGEEGWRLVFEHDPEVACARARPLPEMEGCGLEDERREETPARREESPEGER